MTTEVTRILNAIDQGDLLASEQLLPLVYDELRRLAGRKMSQEKSGHTLQPTALVHEAFMRLTGDQTPQQWEGRGHFFAAAAEAMRRILIENARRRSAEKRGGKLVRCELDEDPADVDTRDTDSLLALDDALNLLAEEDAELAKLVELRYFTGMTVEQAADVLGVSPRTVKRNWAYARAWLKRAIDGEQ